MHILFIKIYKIYDIYEKMIELFYYKIYKRFIKKKIKIKIK